MELLVGYSEVIAGRNVLVSELEICWEIPESLAKHDSTDQPHPDGFPYRKIAFTIVPKTARRDGRNHFFELTESQAFKNASTPPLI
jgi:hypothetical protein